MGKIRIAVAGAGLIGHRHIELALASPSCELSAIVDPAPGAEAIASKAGVRLFETLDELFDTDRPDGVILATPNQLHVEHALKCIDAGVPMLLEKPVAHTLEEGARLCDLADAAKAKILVGHHRAHSPIMARAKEVVEQGVLGKLVAVMGSAMFYKPDDYYDAAPWRRQPGGGPILLNMIHEVHNLRMLCGDIIAVQAFSSNATRGFPVEDTVAINLRFASGVLGTFLLSDTAGSPKSWEQTSQENKSYPTYPDEDCYVVAGTFGSLAVPTMRLKTYEKKEDRSWWKPFQVGVAELERADPLERQLEHFCAVIRDEAKPLVTARDGLENLRITEAIVKAARTGQIVNTEAHTH
ncbi:MAG: Gfo/Idh/MocA family oxidoreductase [candidate division NC10 bacterium]